MTKISRRRKHFVILPLCALSLLIGVVTVQAATYYVAKTGNDAGTCATAQTIATPKKTIASGVACLNPGDTLYIRSGIWTDQIDVSAKTGTPGNYITVAGYPGETVTLNGSYGPFAIKGTYSSSNSYFIFENMILDGVNSGNLQYWTISGDTVSTSSHDIILRNLEIKNWKGNGILIGADNIQIINCKIHDQISLSGLAGERWYGIYFHHGANGLIQGNQIYGNPGGGMQVYPGPISNLAIQRNRIYHNNTLPSSGIGGIFAGAGAGLTELEISNNLIYSNGQTGPAYNAPGIEAGTNTAPKIWNNTIYDNKGYGVTLSGSTTNALLQNNIVYSNATGQISDGGTGTTRDHNLTTDPSFVNAAGFDFHLQTNSPAIDAGAFLIQVTTDFKMVPRPQGRIHDLGAFELVTGSDTLPPNPPKGLGVH